MERTTFVVYVENGIIKLASNGYNIGTTGLPQSMIVNIDKPKPENEKKLDN